MSANEAISPAEPDPTPATPAAPVTPTPAPNIAPAQAYTVQQLTQFNTGIPASAWTPQSIQHYHDKVAEILMDSNRVILDNNARINTQRWRDFCMGILWLLAFGAIMTVGFWLYYLGRDLGKDLIIATVSVAAGFASGYGTAQIKRQ